jgi:hypothetical protein
MRTALENKTHSAGITLRCRVNDFCSPSYQLVLETEKASSGWLIAQKQFWREHIVPGGVQIRAKELRLRRSAPA